MSFLRGSQNYVWCTTSVLGKGATGAVFQGVNRHTGEPVAVKTFNQLSHMRPQEVQMREFEVLKKVNHENIVKLLDIEEEQDGRGKVFKWQGGNCHVYSVSVTHSARILLLTGALCGRRAAADFSL